MTTYLDHITIPQRATKSHSKVPIAENIRWNCLWGMKPPQSYSFRSIHWAIPISVTNSPRVRSKITPYDTHQSTLMSPRYSNVTTSICWSIIWYASNNFRFIIFSPTQRTSKSAPRFLPEKQGRKRASTPMHRLPQCHLENQRVECQNIYQVNQYNTPLSPRVFICETSIKCSQIHINIQSDKMKSPRENSIHHNKIEREKHHMI